MGGLEWLSQDWLVAKELFSREVQSKERDSCSLGDRGRK